MFYALTSRHPETFHVRRTDLGKEFIAAILQKVKPEYQVHDLSLLRPLVVLSLEVHRVSLLSSSTALLGLHGQLISVRDRS